MDRCIGRRRPDGRRRRAVSIDATRWAWQSKINRPAAKLVLLSLADRVGEGNVAWPSVARISRDTGLDRKTIMSCILHLEQIGLVSAEKKPGVVTAYKLLGVPSRHGDETELLPVPKTGQVPVPETGSVPKTVQVPELGQDQCQKRDTHQSQKRDTNLPIEPTKNLPKKNRNLAKPDDIPNGVDSAAWADLFQHRQQIGHPLTMIAAKKTATLLAKYPPAVQRSMVDTTITQGWRGVFEPKGQQNVNAGAKNHETRRQTSGERRAESANRAYRDAIETLGDGGGVS